jgi:hypothetical protein
MKTAMQELIEKLSMKSGDSFYALAFYHDNDEIIKEALEKEKEQIVDAYADGIDHDYTDLDIEFGIADSDRQNHAEKYYNQTYNQ